MMSEGEIRREKQELRDRVWKRIEDEGVGRFPGTRGRIPNFQGAERAASMLEELEPWKKAKCIKANPDSPQRPARKRALEAGKVVYMAVPRLRKEKCFIELDPERLSRSELHRASSIKGAGELGRPVSIDEMNRVDLVLSGSVAVTEDGRRLGKGGGFSDLEFALLVEAGKLGRATPVVTTVHPVQIVPDVPTLDHDFRLDYIVTVDGIAKCAGETVKPRGIDWDRLDSEKLEAIPVLRRLRASHSQSSGKKSTRKKKK